MNFKNCRNPNYVTSRITQWKYICNQSYFRNSYTGFDAREYRTYIQNTYFEEDETLVKDKDMSEELKIAYERESIKETVCNRISHQEKQYTVMEAFKRYEILSDFKNVTAKFNLARLYRDGIFDEYASKERIEIVADNDFDKALELYKELFDSGHIEAVFDIGMTYQRKYERLLGLYLSIPDFAEQIKNNVKTEMNDNVEKSLNCYIKGFELDYQNNQVSLEEPSNKNLDAFIRLIFQEYNCEYFKDYLNNFLSTKNGDFLYIFASIFLDFCKEKYYYHYNNLYRQAFNCFLLSAEKGNSLAQFKVGYFYNKGIYVEKDIQKSLEWFKKSALQNNVPALENVYGIYEKFPKLNFVNTSMQQ